MIQSRSVPLVTTTPSCRPRRRLPPRSTTARRRLSVACRPRLTRPPLLLPRRRWIFTPSSGRVVHRRRPRPRPARHHRRFPSRPSSAGRSPPTTRSRRAARRSRAPRPSPRPVACRSTRLLPRTSATRARRPLSRGNRTFRPRSCRSSRRTRPSPRPMPASRCRLRAHLTRSSSRRSCPARDPPLKTSRTAAPRRTRPLRLRAPGPARARSLAAPRWAVWRRGRQCRRTGNRSAGRRAPGCLRSVCREVSP